VCSWPITYSSRNFLISCGTGSDVRAPPRASNLLSSAMMSLQTSTHSSQMKTVGPAISLRTSFWSLLQNEQRRTSPSVAFLVVVMGACLSLLPAGDHVVDDAVRLRLLRVHDEVAVGVGHDALERLLGVGRQDLVDAVLGAQDLLRLDRDVGGLPLRATPRL